MRKNIHPTNNVGKYVCNSCSTTYTSLTTVSGDVRVEVCSHCHPVYTGEAGVVVDSDSRIDQFMKAAQLAEANKDALVKKRKKLAQRKQRTDEVKADQKLTLRDMLKQN